mmetsp:Transcript_54502/g.158335  ORF Transcript_54502/g.158335 Transcript_54502/m.158335 type:complete len:438 (-) Transcript_54502:276-1589(-)
MVTFVPPPLHVPRSKLLQDGVVAPYAADANQLKIWQKQQVKHQKALEHVPKLTDQSTPIVAVDTSLISAKERSRAFAADAVSKHVASENRRLIGHLSDIEHRPNAFSQMAKERPKVPKRGVEAERRRNREIARENEFLVKRLLSVKTSFNRKEDEKDYKRHRRDIERLGKIKGPPPPIRSVSSGTLARPPPPQLFGATPPAPLAASAPVAALAIGSDALLRRSRAPPSRTLPPLPKAVSASRSMPSLTADGSPCARSGDASGRACESDHGEVANSFASQPASSSWADVEGVSHEKTSRPSIGSLGVPPSAVAMASTSHSSAWRASVYTVEGEGLADESRMSATPDLTAKWMARVLSSAALPSAAGAVGDSDVAAAAEVHSTDAEAGARGNAEADEGAPSEVDAQVGAALGATADADIEATMPDEAAGDDADAEGDGG